MREDIDRAAHKTASYCLVKVSVPLLEILSLFP
jgi:hypothetical protein